MKECPNCAIRLLEDEDGYYCSRCDYDEYNEDPYYDDDYDVDIDDEPLDYPDPSTCTCELCWPTDREDD